VDVADHGHRRAYVDDVALTHEHLLRLLAYLTQEGLVKKLLSHKLLDALIEVEGHGR
jgi:hypothetical protein